MANTHHDGDNKSRFGAAGLPVSPTYLYPESRNRGWVYGVALGGVIALFFVGNLVFQSGDLVSSGPLSASHAVIGDNCVACHTPFGEVSSDKCSACHEDSTDSRGLFTFDAHYVYVSGDRTRAHRRDGEVDCTACHTEHGGQFAAITTGAETACAACHEFDRFGAHPDFDVEAEPDADDGGLAFTHIRHVDRVLEDRATGDLEVACLACHTPTEDARRFEPIAFAQHCADCHLGPDVESVELPLQPGQRPLVAERGGSMELTLGVETLETVRARQGPGEQWALDMSGAQFDADDGYVVKRGIAHEDPWVTHNLGRLQRAIFPSGGLADLLPMSADVRPQDEAVLYAEASATLRGYADGLRGRAEPWVQAELRELDRLAAGLEGRLADRNTSLNDAQFRLSSPDPRLDVSELEEIGAFAEQVAEPCLGCHTVTRATIDRVRPAQHVLDRAKFNHAAHVQQRGCLDCHSRIPFEEYLGGDGPVDAALDRSAIQNLPAAAECRQCHAPDLASDRCQNCHEFHPDTDGRHRLLR